LRIFGKKQEHLLRDINCIIMTLVNSAF
jgi:hypothetical protein